MRILMLFFLIILPLHKVWAQRYYPSGILSREQISIGAGSSKYFGDLQEEGYFSSTLHIMGSYEYLLRPRLGLRADGVWYQLKASDANSPKKDLQTRNLSFHSSNVEVSSALVFYLLKKAPAAYQERPLINFYGLIGLGATWFNPKATYKGNTYVLHDYQTEGVSYNRFTPVVPIGLGLQLKASPSLDITLETSYRFTFSDYLDDVSTKYIDQNTFTSEIAAALADRRQELGLDPVPGGRVRGNPAVNDGFGLYSIRLSYHLERMYYKGKDKKEWLRP